MWYGIGYLYVGLIAVLLFCFCLFTSLLHLLLPLLLLVIRLLPENVLFHCRPTSMITCWPSHRLRRSARPGDRPASAVGYLFVTIIIIGDLVDTGVDGSSGAVYDVQNGVGLGTACTAGSTNGSAAGVTWWTMMNSGLYEESPPPPQPPPPPVTATPIKTSPSSTPITTSSTASTSPSSVTSNTGPLHVPVKRIYSGECVESGVIRHSHHGSQPWNYSPNVEGHTPASAFDQYGNTPTYYNLADPGAARDGRKVPSTASTLSFWSPAAPGSTADYKYPSSNGTPGTSADSAVSCHQTFSQSWSYSPYSSARHHESHHHHPHAQAVPYLPAEDRRVTAAMVADGAGFPHDSYALRNYGPEPVPSTPYPPPGT